MIAAKLIELIEIHANRLTADVTRDLATNERTRGFRAVRPQDLEQRIFQIFHHLGNWIGDPRSRSVQAEFGEWGRRRFDQGIPLSEIVYAVIVLKQHMARYILDNGLVDASFPRIDSDYVLPMHLNSLQELNTQVGQFFRRGAAPPHVRIRGRSEAPRAAAPVGDLPLDPRSWRVVIARASRLLGLDEFHYRLIRKRRARPSRNGMPIATFRTSLHDQNAAVLIWRFDMTSARASIAELLGSGMTLTASEAVAIARAALAFDPARAAGSDAPSGLPLSDTIFVEPDGSIVSLHTAPPTISEVASLRSLLPDGSPGVPGGLRYAIARALGEVDAPPFTSPEDFSIVLSRFQTASGPSAAHRQLGRVDPGETVKARERVERRRPDGATVTNLRRALREADSQLYEQRRAADGTGRGATPRVQGDGDRLGRRGGDPAVHGRRDHARSVRRRRRPATEPPARFPLPATSCSTRRRRNPRSRPWFGRRSRRARATRSVPASAKSTKNRGSSDRLHMQWLKKAFS